MMTVGPPKRRCQWSQAENSEGEGCHSEEAIRGSSPDPHHGRGTFIEGVWHAPWNLMKGTMEQISHVIPHPSHETDGFGRIDESGRKRRNVAPRLPQLPSLVGNVLTDVTQTVGACVDACLPPILLHPPQLWLQYPKPHVEISRNVDRVPDAASVATNPLLEKEIEHEIKASQLSLRAIRPNFVATSLPPRLVNSFRVESMHEHSEWNQSYFPIFRLFWRLLQQWYHQMEQLVRPMPLILWPLLLLLAFFFPMLPLVVIPLAALVYHYGAQLYRNFVIPTPERVLEFVNWIYHFVTGWWTRFVGRARLDPCDEDDDTHDIRTRKRTALAVSLAAHAAGVGGTKRK